MAVVVNVDDNELSRYARNRVLRHAGFEVHDAATGEQALQLIPATAPDLILLDVHLPDIDGLNVCRRIKAQPESASVIVLQISATAVSAPQAKAALENGADAYLAEPVDPDVLVATVRALLRLRIAERELARTNSALRDANQRLESLNNALARSNRDLEHFAHIASHDLRDPLRTITSYVQLLDRSLGDNLQEKQRGYMSFVVDAARRMTALIDDLLTWSSIAPADAELRPVALRDAVEWALENLDDQIQDTKSQIICGELPTVLGDRLQLAQLFQNLIGNSIKYRQDGAALTIHIDAKLVSEQEWLVSVRDNGIGIAPEYHARIFDPFKRLHGREIQGSGIGLAVCRRIVENMGGAIWVESQAGDGATFFFRLKPAIDS